MRKPVQGVCLQERFEIGGWQNICQSVFTISAIVGFLKGATEQTRERGEGYLVSSRMIFWSFGI